MAYLRNYQEKEQVYLVNKCLNNLVPWYLSDYFRRNHSFRSYNSRRREDINSSRPKLGLGILSGTLERF